MTKPMPSPSIMRGAGRALLLVATLAALSACNSLGQLGQAPASTLPPPERLGTGANVIGVLAAGEPDNLAGGAPDSIFQAARLGATSIVNSSMALELRAVGRNGARDAATQLATTGARIVILPPDLKAGGQAAGPLADRGIPAISVARMSDPARHLFGAGFDPIEEASALTGELTRRGIAKVAVVGLANEVSQNWAHAVGGAFARQGITATLVDGSTPDAMLQGLGSTADLGAVVFAMAPEAAADLASALRADPARVKLLLVGSTEWALAGGLPPALNGAIYAVPEGNGLQKFAGRFTATYSQRPTLASALVYDLIIMAAALQSIAPEAPYTDAALAGPDGFLGFTGPFAFGVAGLATTRSYTIVVAK
ncbi:MAG TPA: hypothetical protein VL147_09000 [Devosia sp.]|nr:hypothetical protein [Devosia sp.]